MNQKRFFSRRNLAAFAGLLAVAALATGCPNTASGPLLNLSQLAFTFPEDADTRSFTISNGGAGTLTWSASSVPAWLTVDPPSGSVGGTPQRVTLTVQRDELPQGMASTDFLINSNGGSRTVGVSVVQPGPAQLAVSPNLIDLGTGGSQGAFTISNPGGEALDWDLQLPGEPWVADVSHAGDSMTEPGGQTEVQVTANRAEAPLGVSEAQITVVGGGSQAVVTVRIEVEEVVVAPQLEVNPLALTFASGTNSQSTTVSNLGSAPLNWTATPDKPWILVSSGGGTLPAGGAAPLEVRVDRSTLTPGTSTGAVVVADADGDAQFTVQIAVVVPEAQLSVTPGTVTFGGDSATRRLAVGNPGPGEIEWDAQIAYTARPSGGSDGWLSLSPNNGAATSIFELVNLNVERGDRIIGRYEARVTFVPDDGTIAPVTVEASMDVEPIYDFAILSGGEEVDSLFIQSDSPVAAFTIQNTGTDKLDLLYDLSDAPAWLTDLRPEAGETSGPIPLGGDRTYVVELSPTGLSSGEDPSYTVVFESTGVSKELQIDFDILPRATVALRPDTLDFLPEAVLGQFSVANDGDIGTVLDFRVDTDTGEGWVFFSPTQGQSVGVPSPLDWQPINIAIDRYALRGRGGRVEVRIESTQLDVLEEEDPDLYEILTIDVDTGPLTFNVAPGRMRIPSQVRMPFIMRNIYDEAFALPIERLMSPPEEQGFRIIEDEIPLDETESNQFVTEGARLRGNVAIVLDYSNSTATAAGGSEALHQLYMTAVEELMAPVGFDTADPPLPAPAEGQMPGSWRFALYEFHDRTQPVRMIQDFTTDRQALLESLSELNITEHGATPLLPTVANVATSMAEADFPNLPFYDADVRALILLSDGFLTTPPGEIDATIQFLNDLRVSFYGVGWGSEVNHEPMARMAARTGGHYYPAQAQGGLPALTQRLVNPAADLQEQPGPVAEEEVPTESNVPAEEPGKMQLLRRDLSKYMALSYITLNESPGVPVRVIGDIQRTYYSEELQEETTVTLSARMPEQTFDFDVAAGDTRVGQISMRGPAMTLENGSRQAEAILRCDHAPRGVGEFRFMVTAQSPVDVIELVPEQLGGIVSDWTLDVVAPAGPNGGGFYEYEVTLTSPPDDPTTPEINESVLRYGSFGDLIRVLRQVDSGVTQYAVLLEVDNSIYTNGDLLDPASFVYADAIVLEREDVLAPALPLMAVNLGAVDYGSTDSQRFVSLFTRADLFPANPPLVRWTMQKPDWLTYVDTEAEPPAIVETGILTVDEPFFVGVLEADRTALGPGQYADYVVFTYEGLNQDISGRVVMPVFLNVPEQPA